MSRTNDQNSDADLETSSNFSARDELPRNPETDVVVIGGGPAGSTAATLLAEQGFSVVLLEREHFPRFQIGESLLPYNNELFRSLGIWDALEKSGFVSKFGAEFNTGDGSVSRRFRFGDTLPPAYAKTFQVRRAEFDQILLQTARERGVRIEQGCRVTSVDLGNPAAAIVRTVDEEGRSGHLDCRMVVDASGHAGVVAGRRGARIEHPTLRKIAVFGHYRGVEPSAEGEASGNIVISLLRNGWFWLIPLSDELTSVGLVVDGEELRASGVSPEELLERTIRSAPYTAARMTGAERVTPVYARRNFSYRVEQLVGPNYALVGDAAGFIDPIFSTGVLLAMKSAELSVEGISERLSTGSLRLLERYEREMNRALDRYERFIARFYRREFLEVFLHPHSNLGIVSVLIRFLAGDAFEKRTSRWKLEMFYALVAIQRLSGVVAPRILWENLPSASFAAASEVDVA